MKIPAGIFAFAFLALLWTDRAEGVDFSTDSIGGQRVTICRVHVKQERLQIFLRDDKGVPLKSFENLGRWLSVRGEKLLFAMNAGMYRPDFSPCGLYVSEDHQLSPLILSAGIGNFYLKPNGVFLLTTTGARVIESSQYPKFKNRTLLATQSGPLLVLNGQIHPAFKPGSEFRLIRNGVGVPSPDIAVFAITEGPVNLYDFALYFRDVLHCQNALYLDGNVSSLYAPSLSRSDRHIDLGPMIGVTEPVPVSP